MQMPPSKARDRRESMTEAHPVHSTGGASRDDEGATAPSCGLLSPAARYQARIDPVLRTGLQLAVVLVE